MAALHKLKLFASHCGVARSPAQSPRASPLVQQIRRPKTTLRTLLSLNLSLSRTSRAQQEAPLLQEHHHDHEKGGKDLMRRHSLKDLFVSSPPREVGEEMGRAVGKMGLGGPGNWAGSGNPVWRGFRCRSSSSSLLRRKAWRPLLLTIPECD